MARARSHVALLTASQEGCATRSGEEEGCVARSGDEEDRAARSAVGAAAKAGRTAAPFARHTSAQRMQVLKSWRGTGMNQLSGRKDYLARPAHGGLAQWSCHENAPMAYKNVPPDCREPSTVGCK